MKPQLAVLVFAVACLLACAPKCYRLPITEAANWCRGYCANDYVRCEEGVKHAKGNCMDARTKCVADCPGAVEVSEEEYFGDAGRPADPGQRTLDDSSRSFF